MSTLTVAEEDEELDDGSEWKYLYASSISGFMVVQYLHVYLLLEPTRLEIWSEVRKEQLKCTLDVAFVTLEITTM